MEFWALNLASGNEASCQADGMTGLRLTGAAIRDGKGRDATATLRCIVDGGPPMVLCTLRRGGCEQMQLHASFSEDEDVEFRCEGNATLSVVGYRYLVEDDDESVSEFESDVEDDDVPQLVPADDDGSASSGSEDEGTDVSGSEEEDIGLESDEELDEVDVEDEEKDGTDLKEGERVGKRGIKGKGGWVMFKDSKDQALFEEMSGTDIDSEGFDTSSGEDSDGDEE